ncbi:MAG: RNase adapter RapZ [Lachnospiraceae bacterium]|nr:RNase adapter RapZ [Lachnospiraceae bacterium]
MRFVIVTGMSGGGKSAVLKMLEDVGFYCVDNLPVPLIEKFAELTATPNSEIGKVALGLDVRVDQPFEEACKVMERLRADYKYEVIFMDASDQVLLKRYKETRRVHPLSPQGRVEEGIHREREILKAVKASANYVIDTSNLLVRELKGEIDRIFVRNGAYNSLMVTILSFGFKYGIPGDADLVFDVRFLPNPYYMEELRPQTGNDSGVQEYVLGFPEAGEFLDRLEDMLRFLIPNYVKEGKNQLVIGIGCTGGKHRSVTLANELYKRMENKGEYGLKIYHRDVKQGV